MKIGIIDLISYPQSSEIYNVVLQPSMVTLMPQVIATWLDQAGHDVSYHLQVRRISDKGDLNKLPKDLDLVFVSTYTMNAYVAYRISAFYRAQGAVTVIGGPHARSYEEDSSAYFNIVVKLCDQDLIHRIVRNVESREITSDCKGIVWSSNEHCLDYPDIRKRLKYIEASHTKSRFIEYKPIPLVTSVGCGNGCGFCIDSTTEYNPITPEQIYRDLKNLSELSIKRNSKYLILLHDPNLERGLDLLFCMLEGLNLKNIKFIGELPLNKLTNDVLSKLKKYNFIGIGPGLESWKNYNKKSGTSNDPVEKVGQVAEKLRNTVKYVPAIQLNLLFGLDQDCKDASHFDLTRDFINRLPAVYMNFQTLTMFGKSTPMRDRMIEKDRLLDVPYTLLDGFSVSNIVLDCDPIEFYTRYSELIDFSSSLRINFLRIMSVNDYRIKLYYFLKLISERFRSDHFKQMVKKMKKDKNFYEFFTGQSKEVPSLYENLIAREIEDLTKIR